MAATWGKTREAARGGGARPALRVALSPGGRLAFEADRGEPGAERAIEFIKRIPDRRYQRSSGLWTAPISANVAAFLTEELPPTIDLKIGTDVARSNLFTDALAASAAEREAAGVVQELAAMLRAKDPDTTAAVAEISDLYQFKRAPYLHQRIMFLLGCAVANAGIHTDVGLGKTQIAINLAEWRFLRGEVTTALIIAPSHALRTVWADEIKINSSLSAGVLRAEKDYRKAAEGGFSAHTFYLLGWGIAAKCLVDRYGAPDAAASDAFDMLVIDEAHRAKSGKAKRTKALATFSREARRLKFRLTLSGNITPRSLEDAFWPQFILDGGATFGADLWQFLNAYFFSRGEVWAKWIPYKGTKDEIRKRLERTCVSFYRRECIDLPPVVEREFQIEASAEQRALIDEIRNARDVALDTLLADADPDAEVSDAFESVSALNMREREVCGGFIRIDGEIRRLASNPKGDLLAEHLEDVPDDARMLVWVYFREEAEIVAEIFRNLKISVRVVVGGLTNNRRDGILLDFKEDRFRALVATYGTISESQNLAYVSEVFHYSSDWDYGTRYQAEGRTERLGSEQHAAIYRRDYTITDSIDDEIRANLRAKGNLRAFMQHQREQRTKRRLRK